MIIIGTAIDDTSGTLSPITDWDHSPEDPFALEIEFVREEFTWCLSLEVLREAMANPWDMRGDHDVKMALGDTELYIHLVSQDGTATIGFPVADVQAFLDQLDDGDIEQTVADAIEEFLEGIDE